MTPTSRPKNPAPLGYYHVIRSSGENLNALQTYFDTHRPGAMVQPTLTVYRRTGRKRRPKAYQVLMYPGYAFVRPETLPDLQLLEQRWTHHFLRSATTHIASIVPENQVNYALQLQFRSLLLGDYIPRGSVVKFLEPSLEGLIATVQESREHYAVVWVKDADFPITCLLTDLEVVSPPPLKQDSCPMVRGTVVDG